MINYSLEPKEFMKLDITSMSSNEVRELAYFIWCVYGDSEETELLSWRKEKLLPALGK
jgi:hypothetical protein